MANNMGVYYKILKAVSPEDLEKEVNKQIQLRAGWRVTGGVSLFASPYGTMYVQAVTKLYGNSGVGRKKVKEKIVRERTKNNREDNLRGGRENIESGERVHEDQSGSLQEG